MASDLKRAEPSTEASDRISPSEADLVAYWTFEEGSGYLVKDVTANKHDLHIQQPPHWRVRCASARNAAALLSNNAFQFRSGGL